MAHLIQEHPELRSRIAAGTTAGVLGGVFFMAFQMLIHTLFTGNGPLLWPNLLATLFGFSMHLDFGIYSLAGTALHFASSAVLGLLWGLLMPFRLPVSVAILMGMLYGMLVFWFLFFMVLPFISPIVAQLSQSLPVLVSHLLFGLGFAFYPKLLE